MDILLVIYAVLSAIALLEAAAMLLLTYEHARYIRSRLRQRLGDRFNPRAEILVPCKGVETGFDSMVKTLLGQEYPAYRATFVVESKEDPAWGRLKEQLGHTAPAKARILVAGQARDCGQKVYNLLAATDSLEPSVEVLAFVDSDSWLTPDWLRRMIDRLHKPDVGAVTGYRWFIPLEKDWCSAVLSALNGVWALAMGNHRWNQVWGGSWAISRKNFEAAGIRQAWQGTLSDDYAVWRALRRARLRVAFEPGCLVASPVRYSWPSLLEFVRRQYLITRIYAPGLWWFVVFADLIFNGAFWGGMILGLWIWIAGNPAWWIAPIVILLYVLSSLRAKIRQSAAAVRFADYRESLLLPSRLDIWLQPLLALCNLTCLLSSAVGRTITWRGIRYRMDGPNRTQIIKNQSISAAEFETPRG